MANAVFESDFQDPEGLYFVAFHLAVVGELEQAAAAFDRIVGSGFYCYLPLSTDPVLADLREHARSRQQLLEALRFLSPAIVVQLALEDIAGSGAARQQHFEAQVDALHDRFRTHAFRQVREGHRLGPEALSAMPSLAFT